MIEPFGFLLFLSTFLLNLRIFFQYLQLLKEYYFPTVEVYLQNVLSSKLSPHLCKA